MPIPTFTGLGPQPEFIDLVRKINTLVQELQNLMLSLDTLNIVELNAEVIIAGTITAEKMNVDKLSAISADMGKLTSGEIYGAYIATAEGTFPRIEFSSLENLLRASFDGNKSIAIRPITGTTPNLLFKDGSNEAFVFFDSEFLNMLTTRKININANQGTFINNLTVDNGARIGSISVPNAGTPTVETVFFVLNELINALRSMRIIA